MFGQVATPVDDPGHPYGQWSAVLERVGSGLRLSFLSEKAPAVGAGAALSMFRGRRLVARLTVAGPSGL